VKIKSEIRVPLGAITSLALVSFTAHKFSSSVRRSVRERQNHTCLITGEPITQIHHRTPKYFNTHLNKQTKPLSRQANALGVSAAGHALIHAIRAQKAEEKGQYEIADFERDAVYGAINQLKGKAREAAFQFIEERLRRDKEIGEKDKLLK